MSTVRLKNANVVTTAGVVRRDVVIAGNKIKFDVSKPVAGEKTVDCSGKYVIPGLIDIHFHGYNLFEFTAGLYDAASGKFDNSEQAYKKGFEGLRKQLASFGVTGIYMGTWAAPIEQLKHCFRQLREYCETQDTVGAKILGGLVEGTFINPNMAGAQNPKYVFEPSVSLFDSIEDGGCIKLVNVAPEFNERSCRLTGYLAEKGIVVGAGHSLASGDQIQNAVNAGLKYWVHFLNGPTGHNFKPFDGGGAVEAVLRNENIYAEQIVDGWHINPQYVLDVIERKGIDRVLAVTDALYAAGSPLKTFDLGGVAGEVFNNEYIRVVGKANTLCSSTLTMDRAFSNLLNWLTVDKPGIWNRMHKAHSLEDAAVLAAKACSTSPAELMGLSGQGYGSIGEGRQADLCVVEIDGTGGNYKLTVEKTIVDGQIVYSKN